MRYSLRPGLSYCMIDGQAIFLDIDEDRYFRLDGTLQDAFVAYVNSDGVPATWADALIDRAILVPGPAIHVRPDRLPAPCRSSLELTAASTHATVTAVLHVFASVWRMSRQLATRSLRDILEELVIYRNRHKLCAASSDSQEERTIDIAGLFARSRLYVPVKTCCLLDSLAMTRYLAGHGVPANIVFGVTRDPFSAHCWVQYGDLVLNDTVGNVNAHTPIRVI
jgi:hypothetical protein